MGEVAAQPTERATLETYCAFVKNDYQSLSEPLRRFILSASRNAFVFTTAKKAEMSQNSFPLIVRRKPRHSGGVS